jgi:hypothetical protein
VLRSVLVTGLKGLALPALGLDLAYDVAGERPMLTVAIGLSI